MSAIAFPSAAGGVYGSATATPESGGVAAGGAFAALVGQAVADAGGQNASQAIVAAMPAGTVPANAPAPADAALAIAPVVAEQSVSISASGSGAAGDNKIVPLPAAGDAAADPSPVAGEAMPDILAAAVPSGSISSITLSERAPAAAVRATAEPTEGAAQEDASPAPADALTGLPVTQDASGIAPIARQTTDETAPETASTTEPESAAPGGGSMPAVIAAPPGAAPIGRGEEPAGEERPTAGLAGQQGRAEARSSGRAVPSAPFAAAALGDEAKALDIAAEGEGIFRPVETGRALRHGGHEEGQSSSSVTAPADTAQRASAMPQPPIDLSLLTGARPARGEPIMLATGVAGETSAAAHGMPAAGADADGQGVPLRVLPIEIGLKAMAGLRQFDIRLDPGELGRVDVKLSISDEGEVSARLVVDRVDTLHLLQRDARTLERAFEQAGLKPSENGVDISLRDPSDQSGQRRQAQDEPAGPVRPVSGDADDSGLANARQPEPVRRIVRLGGIDVSV